MVPIWIIILLHQLVFQGMFLIKNILLSKKIDKKIHGKNIEASLSIGFFTNFIGISLLISLFEQPLGAVHFMSSFLSASLGIVLLCLNLIISAASLINMKDSWRVGVIEEQKTQLITTGIYRFTRNPYFVSYILMFAAYTVLLQNIVLLILSILGIVLIHLMIFKEEKFLYSIHGDSYLHYKNTVNRYLIL